MQKKLGRIATDIVLSVKLELFLRNENALTKFVKLFDVDFHLIYGNNIYECNLISSAFLWSDTNEPADSFNYWSRLDTRFNYIYNGK